MAARSAIVIYILNAIIYILLERLGGLWFGKKRPRVELPQFDCGDMNVDFATLGAHRHAHFLDIIVVDWIVFASVRARRVLRTRYPATSRARS
jgi:hypothetical protein